jgi:cytochrome bd-type quinol oxidase subunit 2
MSPRPLRNRMNVVLQMVTAIIIVILLGQLWLFTVTLDNMESRASSLNVEIAAVILSLLGCCAVWMLIRFFLRTEQAEIGAKP